MVVKHEESFNKVNNVIRNKMTEYEPLSNTLDEIVQEMAENERNTSDDTVPSTQHGELNDQTTSPVHNITFAYYDLDRLQAQKWSDINSSLSTPPAPFSDSITIVAKCFQIKITSIFFRH